MQGYQFTCSRSRGKPNAVEEMLDRAFGNSEWMALFPDAQLNNLVAAISDHSPLLLKTIQLETLIQKRKFRFENKWLREPDFKELVQNSWDAGSSQDLLPRLEMCSELLSSWGKQRFTAFKRSINQYKQKLEQLRNYSDPDSVEEYDTIRKTMIDLLVQEEDHWRQRAKSFWFKERDLNTKFLTQMQMPEGGGIISKGYMMEMEFGMRIKQLYLTLLCNILLIFTRKVKKIMIQS